MPASRMKRARRPTRRRRPSRARGSRRGRRETPKMTARSVPDRALRCQPSPRAIASGSRPCRGRPADGPPRQRPRSPASSARSSRGDAPRRWPARRSSRFQISACSRSSAAIASISGCVSCCVVGRLLVALERLDEVRHGVASRAAARRDDEPHPQPRPRRRRARTAPSSRSRVAQMSAWRRSLSAMCRNAAARRGSRSIEARASYRTIASCSSLRLSRLWAMFTSPAYRRSGAREAGPVGLPRRAAWRPTLGSQRSPMPDLPPLRYLTSADVTAAMPPLPERLALAETVLRGLAGDAELPPKIGVHPRPAGSFGARDARLPPGRGRVRRRRPRGHEVGARRQPEQRARHPRDPRHAPAQRPRHGRPDRDPRRGADHRRADGGDSGVAIRAWAPPVDGRAPRAAIIGAGVQGRSHVPVIGHVLPGVRLAVFDRDPARAEALAAYARDRRRDRRRRRRPRRARRGRGRGRRRHRGVVRRAARAPGDDRGLARRRDARRPGGLRDVLRGLRRPRRGRCSSSTTATSSSPTARRASSTTTRTRRR